MATPLGDPDIPLHHIPRAPGAALAAYYRLQGICEAFPEVTERPDDGVSTWFVRERRAMVTLWHGHHDDGYPHLWCAAPAGAQDALRAADSDRPLRPPTLEERGGVDVRLDEDVDWDLVAVLCTAAFRHVAPPSLVAAWDARVPRHPTAPPTSREKLDIPIDT